MAKEKPTAEKTEQTKAAAAEEKKRYIYIGTRAGRLYYGCAVIAGAEELKKTAKDIGGNALFARLFVPEDEAPRAAAQIKNGKGYWANVINSLGYLFDKN